MPARTAAINTPRINLIAESVSKIANTEATIRVLETRQLYNQMNGQADEAEQQRINMLKALMTEARALCWEQIYSLSQEEMRALSVLL